MSASPLVPGKTRRTLVLAIVGAVILVVALSGGAVAYTAQPSFCNSCHLMETRYLSWQRSTHGTASTCLECHAEPGFIGEIMAHVNGARYLYVLASGQKTGSVIQAHVSDGSCLECHPAGDLPTRTEFHEIAHTAHLSRGVGCTECHAGLVHGSLSGRPVTPAMATCESCHRSTAPLVMNSCTACHRTPGAGMVGSVATQPRSLRIR